MVDVVEAVAGERRPRGRDVLAPIRDKINRRRWVVFDIESKRKDSDEAGFERPFLACFYDGEEYESFRNDDRHVGRSYTEGFWHEPGGCIDSLMRHILGLRACDKCETTDETYKWGTCKACTRARKRFQGKRCMITAHNGGNFDNLFVLGWIRRHAELFAGQEIVNVQSRMLILTFKPRLPDTANASGKEKWTFTDSIAILPLSLREIGKTFCPDNPDVQKMTFDLQLPEDDPRWDEYNRRDCLVLLTALNRFRALVERLGGAVGMTAASTAMQLLRRKFLKAPIPRNSHFPDCDGRCHDEFCEIEECRATPPDERECHGCMHAFVREAFFGGRTEVYRMAGRDLTYMDINSSYPTAMLGDMPIGRSRVLKEGATLSMLRAMGRTYQGFVECIVEVPKTMYLPPLPYRWHKRSGEMKLIFPTGRLYGTWTWMEIEYALSLGCKLLVVGKSVWFQKAKLFDKMITVLYGYRQKKCKNEGCGKNVQSGACKCPKKTWDPGLDFVAKLMMNSCFGKFATNPIREKTVLSDMILPNCKVPPPWMKDAPLKQQHVLKVDYIIPHIAAWITADARIRLHKGLQGVLDKKGQIHYADTDSCLSSRKLDPEGTALGEWKVEERNFSYKALLPKMYMLSLHEESCTDAECRGCRALHKKTRPGTNVCAENELCVGCKAPVKVAMKGVPKDSQRGDVFDLLEGGGEVHFSRLTKFRTMLQKNLDSPLEEAAHRAIRSEYDKRTVLPGGDTRPLCIRDPYTLGEARSLRARLIRAIPQAD